MKIAYIGTADPTDDRVCAVFGMTFEIDVFVEIDSPPEALLNNPTFATEDALAQEAAAGYGDMKVADLRALAAERNVDLGDATKKADIIAAIELHDEQVSSQA